jgi:hypothetical protein
MTVRLYGQYYITINYNRKAHSALVLSITIVKVMLQFGLMTLEARVVIYNRNMLIIQSTDKNVKIHAVDASSDTIGHKLTI